MFVCSQIKHEMSPFSLYKILTGVRWEWILERVITIHIQTAVEIAKYSWSEISRNLPSLPAGVPEHVFCNALLNRPNVKKLNNMVPKRKEMLLICCKRSKKVQLESLFKNSFFQLLINFWSWLTYGTPKKFEL